MKLKFFFLTLAIILVSHVQAKIVTADNYYELKSHLAKPEKGGWVFFDVDFTLVEPTDHALKMASVFKYSNAYRNFFKKMTPEKMDETLSEMMTENETELVDENLPELIEILDNHHYVFGFTGMLAGQSSERGKLYTDLRHKDLSDKGIKFKGNSKLSGIQFFDNMPAYHNSKPVFKNNIIYSNGEKGPYGKADVLYEFLAKVPTKPKTIIMIEDRKKNLKAIENMLQEKYGDTINFIGIHYTQSWHSGTPCLTEEEYLKKLHKILS